MSDSSKEMWWAGFRAALNLPDSVTREQALRIKEHLIGSRALLTEEADNLARSAIAKAATEEPKHG